MQLDPTGSTTRPNGVDNNDSVRPPGLFSALHVTLAYNNIHPVHIKKVLLIFSRQLLQILTDCHNFSCTASPENAKVIGVGIFCHTFVMLLPYRVKVSDTKVTHFTQYLHFAHVYVDYITETNIDETNKTRQKVRGSNFMFKMSTIRANTCIQTTTLLCSRYPDDGVIQQPSLAQQTFFQVFNSFTSWIRER